AGHDHDHLEALHLCGNLSTLFRSLGISRLDDEVTALDPAQASQAFAQGPMPCRRQTPTEEVVQNADARDFPRGLALSEGRENQGSRENGEAAPHGRRATRSVHAGKYRISGRTWSPPPVSRRPLCVDVGSLDAGWGPPAGKTPAIAAAD